MGTRLHSSKGYGILYIFYQPTQTLTLLTSYFEARKIVTAESKGRSSLGSRTAAAVVGSKSVPIRPSTCSAAVQTDLTWPDRQEQPSLIRPSVATGTNQSSQTASSSRIEGSSKSKQSVSPRATTSGFSQCGKTELMNSLHTLMRRDSVLHSALQPNA